VPNRPVRPAPDGPRRCPEPLTDPRWSSRPVFGDACNPDDDASPRVGDACNPAEDASPRVGEACNPAGDASPRVGEACNPAGDASSLVGEACNPVGDARTAIVRAFPASAHDAPRSLQSAFPAPSGPLWGGVGVRIGHSSREAVREPRSPRTHEGHLGFVFEEINTATTTRPRRAVPLSRVFEEINSATRTPATRARSRRHHAPDVPRRCHESPRKQVGHEGTRDAGAAATTTRPRRAETLSREAKGTARRRIAAPGGYSPPSAASSSVRSTRPPARWTFSARSPGSRLLSIISSAEMIPSR